MRVTDKIIQWLLESNTRTNYMTRIDLLSEKMDKKESEINIKNIISEPLVSGLINDTSEYFRNIASRHTDTKLSHYKLRMLADFGLKKEHGLESIINKARKNTDNGFYAIRQAFPVKDYDKTKEWNALPCDAPLILYSLLKMGIYDKFLSNQFEILKQKWNTSEGWFCHLPFVAGQYKREKIGCPMAGLLALEVFSLDDENRESKYAKNAFKTLTSHYDMKKSIYYFGRGRKFYTFKYPFIWYNALYLADVVSRFQFAKKHELVAELIRWIKNGAEEDGKYKPNSIYLEYKDWDFGNKKEPSPWITYICYKIIKQYESKS